MQTYTHSFSSAQMSGAGLGTATVPFGVADRVPSERLNAIPRAVDRLMPWSPNGPVQPDVRAPDLDMLGSIQNVVSEVNTAIAECTIDDEALAGVGVVNRHWSKRQGLAQSGRFVPKVKRSWSDADFFSADEPEAAAPILELPPRPRRGLGAFLRRRAAARKAQAVAMRADLAFQDRLTRIQRGKQWQPDGVMNAVGRHGHASGMPLSQRPNFRFMILLAAVGGLTVVGVGPEALKDYGSQVADRVELANWVPVSGEINQSSLLPGL